MLPPQNILHVKPGVSSFSTWIEHLSLPPQSVSHNLFLKGMHHLLSYNASCACKYVNNMFNDYSRTSKFSFRDQARSSDITKYRVVPLNQAGVLIGPRGRSSTCGLGLQVCDIFYNNLLSYTSMMIYVNPQAGSGGYVRVSPLSCPPLAYQ